MESGLKYLQCAFLNRSLPNNSQFLNSCQKY